MNEQIQARLTELRREFGQGQGQLRELTRQEAALRETLLRISGAIQVLEELTTSEELGEGKPQAPADGNGKGNVPDGQPDVVSVS